MKYITMEYHRNTQEHSIPDHYLKSISRADGLELVFVSCLRRAKAERNYISNTYTKQQLQQLSGHGVMFGHGEEHRHNFGSGGEGYGHVMFLNIKELIRPVSIGPGIMGEGMDWLPLRRGIDKAHRNGATTIWCHNAFGFEEVPDWIAGVLDAHNIFDGGSRGTYEDTFYRFMDIGLRVPFSTGTDWFIYDFSRVYVEVDLDTWDPTPVPDGFDYELWLGPAPLAPHHEHRCFYTFRFVQDYSGGETTNTGAHKFDIVQWGLGTERTGPVEIEDLGSEFPKTGLFDTVSRIHFRARYANGVELICTPSGIGGAARFEGTEGWVHVDWNSFSTHPESLMDTVIGPNEIHLYESRDHKRNFLDCIKSGRDPIAPVEVGHRSASVCHLANIAMRLNRRLHWDPDEESFINDEQANRLLSKPVRAPWHL